MNTEHEMPVTKRALLIHRQGVYLEKHGVYDDLLGKILTKPEITKDEIVELIESERKKVMALMEKTVAEINSDTKSIVVFKDGSHIVTDVTFEYESDEDWLTTIRLADITKSCTHSCSPADWRKGGKCDLSGCYSEKQ